MFAIAPTDIDWFNFLKSNGFNSEINFWTPTPWNLRRLKPNSRFYFMLKSPIRKLGGFGEFVYYENTNVNEAWKKFGYRNCCQSKEEFVDRIESYLQRNSKKFGNQSLSLSTYKIGCIVLKNCEFWEPNNYINNEDYEIKFPEQVVKHKYFINYDPFLDFANNSNRFFLIKEPREKYLGQANYRYGQGKFKGQLLKAYNNACCVTGETCPELLEAAHIQEYLNTESNHIQNGPILRVDIHRLFDNNLLFIDKNYIVHVSSLIKNPLYRQLDKSKISLPTDKFDYPMIEALELRKASFRD